MMMNEGKAVANVVQMAPGTRFILYPIKVLRLIANTPGQLCAIAIKSTFASQQSPIQLSVSLHIHRQR